MKQPDLLYTALRKRLFSDGFQRITDRRGCTMTRRTLREHCFKMLFCTDFYPPEEAEEQIEDYFRSKDEEETDAAGQTELVHQVRLSEEEEAECRAKVDGCLEKLPEIDRLLEDASEGWRLKRMGRVELTILRLACFELRFDESVPEKVAINEAVELAKKFGGEESPAFVNGILAKIV